MSDGPATLVTRTSPGATRANSHSQLTTTARPEPQPMPAGWPFSPGCRSQISSGTIGASTCSGRDCSSLKPLSSIAHSISTGPPASCSAFAQQPAERHRLARREARLAHQILRHQLAAPRRRARRCRDGLCGRPATVRRKPFLAQHDAVGHHLALRDRRAEAPGGGNQHLPFGGFAQAAAGARADISGWISTPIAVSAGDRP